MNSTSAAISYFLRRFLSKNSILSQISLSLSHTLLYTRILNLSKLLTQSFVNQTQTRFLFSIQLFITSSNQTNYFYTYTLSPFQFKELCICYCVCEDWFFLCNELWLSDPERVHGGKQALRSW